MTNEQLAGFIKQGENDELIPLLWERVKKLMHLLSNRYFTAYSDHLTSCGITAEDIRAAAYPAFLRAVESFNECKGLKFTSYLNYPLKNEIRRMITKDPLNTADSIDKPIITNDSGEDVTLLELLPDSESEQVFQRIEDEDEQRALSETLNDIINTLDLRQQYVVKEHYYNNRTYTSIAKSLDMSMQNVKVIIDKALREMRKPKNICRLKEICDYNSYKAYSNSLSSFRRSGMSGVERVAIKRADVQLWEDRVNAAIERLNSGGSFEEYEKEIAAIGECPL